MKIQIAQMEVVQGQLGKNFVNVMRHILAAAEEKVDLIIFPELCITGTMLGDDWNNPNFIKEAVAYNTNLFEAAQKNKISIIWGNVFVGEKIGADDKSTLCNAVFIAQPNHALNYRFKTNLNKYEKQYFTSNLDVRIDYPFDYVKLYTTDNNFGFYNVGLQVGEDIFPNKHNITKELIECNIDFIVNISALPFQYIDDVELQMVAEEPCIMFFANCAGIQTSGKHFHAYSGESGAFVRSGDKVQNNLTDFRAGKLTYDFFNGIIKNAMVRITPKNDMTYRKAGAIVRAYEFIDEMLAKPNYIIGLSGGLDSAVSTALMIEAIEPSRIIALNIHTKYNKEKLKGLAKAMAYKLGITRYEDFRLDATKFDFITALQKFNPHHNVSMIDEGNIITRLRNNVLQSVASINKGIVIDNSNKLDLALGYTIITGGAFCPLGDLTKIEISDIARLINQHIYNGIPVIQEELLFDKDFNCQIQPTMELMEKQVDPMWYGIDDEFISRVIAGESTFESILKDFSDAPVLNDFCANYNIDMAKFQSYDGDTINTFINHIEWLRDTMMKSRCKAIQCPPIVATTKSPIDIQPIMIPKESKVFRRLKEKLLADEEKPF